MNKNLKGDFGGILDYSRNSTCSNKQDWQPRLNTKKPSRS